ncbi:MAG: hypothetical protein KF836_13135 [Fimbriimonadaceae bacterium]|nr:hypothetical protein [Fimbriimonadaceae bacterium]
MGAIIDRLRQWWDTSDRTQKLVTVFGAAFLVLMLGGTVFFASRPKMQPVIPGMNSQDSAAVYEELTKGGFSVEITPQSEVVVPSGDVARAKMYLATKNKMPKSGGGGLALIDSIGIGDSQRKENEKIIAAKERELADSINTMAGVESAQVHLTLGKDSPFGDQTTPPTAAIRITESNEGGVTMEAGKAIARLVQNSTTGMTAKGVTVVSNSGRMIFDGEEQNSTTTMANRKMEAEAAESKRRTTELQRELDMVFGKGNTIVQIDVQLNMDATKINKNETLRTGEAISEETAEEKMKGTGTIATPGSGSISNMPGQPATTDPNQPAGSNGYESTSKSKQYPTSTTLTNIEKAAGEIVAMNVTVMANKSVIDTLKPLEERVASYVAPWQGDPKFTQKVTGVEFNTSAKDAQAKAAASAASAAQMQQIISLLPVAALILVAVFLMKSLSSTIKKSQHQTLVLSNGERLTVPANSDPKLLALIEEASRPITMSLPGNIEPEYEDEEFEEVDPETGETVVVTRQKPKKKKFDDEEDEDLDVESIKKRVDVPLEQIRKMSRRNPEAVAMLLKSWMMEEAR